MATNFGRHFNRKNVITLIIALLTLYVFVPRLSSFKDSFATLRDADFAYVGLSVLMWLITFLAAATVYKLIALKPVPYGVTLLIQLASGFTNRLAPVGAGAIALNIRYLVKRGHSAIQSTALVALNNFLGFVGNAILLFGSLVLGANPLGSSSKIHVGASTILAVGVGSGVVGLSLIVLFSSKLAIKIRETFKVLARSIFRRPKHLALALLSSMAITTCYALALYCLALAFNVHLSIAQTLLVLTLGVVAATITPTPGGLGGAEAGLVAALIAIGTTSHQALTIALTYRFLVYWLPILPGFVCFQLALHRRYI